MKIGALLLLVCALVPSVAGASQLRARVSVVQTASAFAVQGASFKSRERVTVTVTAESTRTKTVKANLRGAFTATFAGFTVPRCEGYSVRAKGNRGSVATLKVIPECPPPRKS